MKKPIKYYSVRQKLEVKDIVRYQGNGEEIKINGIGIIKQVDDFNDDIAYLVEFDVTIEHSSPYGKKWKTNKNTFYILHEEDKNNIVSVI